MRRLIGVFLCLVTPTASANTPVLVTSLQAPAWEEVGGERTPLRVGAELRGNEQITTGRGARVVLRFAEGSDVKFGENTETQLAGAQLASDSAPFTAALNIVKGAFRFTTSLLGRSLKRDIHATVGTATIGIRGTDVWGKASRERDFVVLIEGDIEIQRGGAQVDMATPQTIFNANHGQVAEPIKPVDANDLARWAQETEPVAGRGVMQSEGVWRLQLGPSRNERATASLLRTLTDAGYAAVLESAAVKGRQWYRVVLRDFATLDDAAAVGERLKAQIPTLQYWIFARRSGQPISK